MKGLLYKDFFLFRWTIVILAFAQIILTIICLGLATSFSVAAQGEVTVESGMEIVFSTTVCYFLIFLFARLVSSELFARDERHSSIHFAFSTPPAIKGQLQSKYYTLLLIHLVILFVCFITDTIVVAIVGDGIVSAALPCVLLFCISILLTAIKIPFIVRFGASAGFMVMALSSVVLFVLFGIYVLFGDISFFFTDDPLAAIWEFFQSGKVILLMSFVPYIAIALYYLSYRISLALYRKGAENYEQ